MALFDSYPGDSEDYGGVPGGNVGGPGSQGYDPSYGDGSPHIAPVPTSVVAQPVANPQLPTDYYGGGGNNFSRPASPGLLDRAGDWIGDKFRSAGENPLRTAIDIGLAWVPIAGWANAGSGLFGGPTVGGVVTDWLKPHNFSAASGTRDSGNTSTVHENQTYGDSYEPIIPRYPPQMMAPTAQPAPPPVAPPPPAPDVGGFPGWPDWSGQFAPRQWNEGLY